MSFQIPLFDVRPESAAARLASRISRPLLALASSTRLAVLGSGSGGNAIVIEGSGGCLLIDAGFSCRELERRLRLLGVDSSTIRGVVITHEHGDHCRGTERFARRHRIPTYATKGTWTGYQLHSVRERVEVRAGRPFEVAGFELEPFAVPHDAREPIGLVVTDGDGYRVGLVSDLGCRTQRAWDTLADVSVLILETNHDLEMLRTGPYPWALKRRVAGRYGHLSNFDAASGLEELISDRLSTVVLYHLSRTNNLPALAHASICDTLGRVACNAKVELAEQFVSSGWLPVSPVENDPSSGVSDD